MATGDYVDGKDPKHGELVGSTGFRYQGKGVHERRSLGEQILRRRNEGETIYTIAKDLEISEESAYRYIRLAIAARIAPTVDEHRKQQNDRLDQTQRTIEENLQAATQMAALAASHDPPSLAMLERAISLRSQQIGLQLRLDERRAKLNGLDSPIKVDVEHKAADPWDAEMAEMIRQAKAKQNGEGVTSNG